MGAMATVFIILLVLSLCLFAYFDEKSCDTDYWHCRNERCNEYGVEKHLKGETSIPKCRNCNTLLFVRE